MNTIRIRGAKENNLQNIDIEIPRNKVVCFVGVSGSGKSTIAFDIIAKEGQRQYFESLNAYARRYLQKSNKPNVDHLSGISSTIIIDQERVRNNPRSTVGTLTEAYTYLRMLFSRVGLPPMDSSNFSFNHPDGACPRCKGLGRAIDIDIDKLIDWNKSLQNGAIKHSEWLVGTRMWKIIKATRYFDMDKKLKEYDAEERDLLFYSERVLFQDNEQFGANRWSFQGLVTRLQERNSKVHRSTSERDLIYYTVIDCPECMGGRIIAKGTLKELLNNPNSLTGKYLKRGMMHKKKSIRQPTGSIHIVKANKHNLKDLNIQIPTGVLVALTGVSGSGKSSLIEELLDQHGEKIVLIDQSQVGNSKRGCIGTYTGVFDLIRKMYARKFDMSESFFSFNARGACDQCQGLGFIDMDMNFLGDVKIRCEKCNGTRYKEKVLRYTYNGKTIVDVLKMTAREVIPFFDLEEITQKMDLLLEVGLDYIEIGQTLDTLSGGESQRLKLASRLQSKGEFYVLDEPTTGLHFADIEKLMRLIHRLVDNGNSVLVVEHNLDLIRQADWIIDLGPEGGEQGGYLVAQGTVFDIQKVKESYTGKYLR